MHARAFELAIAFETQSFILLLNEGLKFALRKAIIILRL